jgi:hypothetical protein
MPADNDAIRASLLACEVAKFHHLISGFVPGISDVPANLLGNVRDEVDKGMGARHDGQHVSVGCTLASASAR